MLKKTVTYTDYNDLEVTEDFYFNMTKVELVELDIEDDLQTNLVKIVKAEDAKQAYGFFKKILLMSYGIKAEDGKRFIKSPELSLAFDQSPAIVEIIFGMLEDPNAGAAFVEGIMPAKLLAEAKAAQEAAKVQDGSTPPKAASEMTREELLAAMQARNQEQIEATKSDSFGG